MTLELFLNLAWFAIVIGALCAFTAWAPRADSKRHRVRVGLAMVCGLALLFPIISVTDDLCSDTAALEEWTAARRAALIILTTAHLAVALPTLVVTQPTARETLVCLGLVVLTFTPLSGMCFRTVWSLRAPPLPRS